MEQITAGSWRPAVAKPEGGTLWGYRRACSMLTMLAAAHLSMASSTGCGLFLGCIVSGSASTKQSMIWGGARQGGGRARAGGLCAEATNLRRRYRSRRTHGLKGRREEAQNAQSCQQRGMSRGKHRCPSIIPNGPAVSQEGKQKTDLYASTAPKGMQLQANSEKEARKGSAARKPPSRHAARAPTLTATLHKSPCACHRPR